MTKNYPMVFETMENFFTVHLQDREIVFRQSEGGLCYFNTTVEEDNNGAILTSIIEVMPDEMCLLITLAEKRSLFTPR